MIAIDTNLLVFAHIPQSPFHRRAASLLAGLVASGSPWAIPAHCLAEFFSVVTHPKIYKPASTYSQACTQIDAWLGAPTLTVLGEDAATWSILKQLVHDARLVGPVIHDARIVAVCIQHDVAELWTHDRGFARFPQLHTRDPLLDPLPTKASEGRVRYRVERRGRPSARSARAR